MGTPGSPTPTPPGPTTATGTASRNVDGQAISITVFSTLKWWGRLYLPILFFLAKRVPKLTETLRQLSFIHFARWTLVREIPDNGPPQPRQKLRYTPRSGGTPPEWIRPSSPTPTAGVLADAQRCL